MTLEFPKSAFEVPLPAFLEMAYESLDETEWPSEDDLLFHLVRALKAHPALMGMDAGRALNTLIAVTKKTGAAQVVSDLDMYGEDGMVAFHRTWERVRFPMGSDPVVVSCALASERLIRTQKERPGRYGRFLTVAALLQVQVRQRHILLPSRKIADHMPCQANSVTAWVGWAIEDGVLTKTKEHAFRSKGESRAAEYVFGLHRWKADVHVRLGALVGLVVRAQDLRWIEDQFSTAGRTLDD
jgi:hypothetical protein